MKIISTKILTAIQRPVSKFAFVESEKTMRILATKKQLCSVEAHPKSVSKVQRGWHCKSGALTKQWKCMPASVTSSIQTLFLAARLCIDFQIYFHQNVMDLFILLLKFVFKAHPRFVGAVSCLIGRYISRAILRNSKYYAQKSNWFWWYRYEFIFWLLLFD